MPSSTGTLALSSGTFTSPLNTPGAETKLLASTNAGLQTITTSQNTTLLNVSFAGNSSGSNFVLRSSSDRVTANSSYDFADGNDTLLISSSLKNPGTVASGSTFNLGSGSDKLTFAGGVGNTTVDAGTGFDTIQVDSNTRDSTFVLGSGKDNIAFSGNVANSTVDGGSESDNILFSGRVSDTTVLGDTGNDAITFLKAVTSSNVNSGNNNDVVRFNGSVGSTTIAVGSGSDLLIFGGTIGTDTNVNLGGEDGAIDTIQIARGVSYSGLKIAGASTGDILIIGSTKYTYDPLQDKWINPGKSPLSFS